MVVCLSVSFSQPQEKLCLISSLFRRGSKRRHLMNHENGACILHSITLVNREDMSATPDEDGGCPRETDAAADSRESSEKQRSIQRRKQRVSFLAEACSDLSTIRILKAGSPVDSELGARSIQSRRGGSLYKPRSTRNC